MSLTSIDSLVAYTFHSLIYFNGQHCILYHLDKSYQLL